MKNNKKVLQLVAIVALFLAVVGISVGFAAMSTSLEIVGSAKVVPANWNIEFISNTFSNNGTAAYAGTTPTMTSTTFSGYEIVVTKPGDKGTYTVKVKNSGSIAAKVSTVTLGDTLTVTGSTTDDEDLVRANLTYTITWSNGDAIAVGDELAPGAERDIVITVEYSAAATALPSAQTTVTGRDLTVLFVQA